MPTRTGEKIGWIGGWIGAFCWLPILAAVWIAQGKTLASVAALALTVLGIALVLFFAPWKRPTVRYWKLMVPGYLVFCSAFALTLYALDA